MNLKQLNFYQIVGPLIINTLLLTISGKLWGAEPLQEKELAKEVYHCKAAEEFTATYNFLTDKDTIGLSKKEALPISIFVSKGCTGAAKRFIKVAYLLLKSGISGNDAVSQAKFISQKSDEQAEAFVEIFKASFLRRGLDLDLLTAINLARRFSVEYEGDPEQVMDDYHDLTSFCTSKSELALPKVQCAEIARNFSIFGEKSKIRVAPLFIEGYEFMTSNADGPNLTSGSAIKFLEKIMKQSPAAVKNFMEAYSFATSEDGPSVTRQAAVDIATKVAKHTHWKKGAKKF